MTDGYETVKEVLSDMKKRSDNANGIANDNPDATTHCDAVAVMLDDFRHRIEAAHKHEIDELIAAEHGGLNECDKYFAIYRTDTKRYYGMYYSEGSGDAVMPSGDYPTWHTDVTRADHSMEWACHFKTMKEAEECLAYVKKYWGAKCAGEIKIVEVSEMHEIRICNVD